MLERGRTQILPLPCLLLSTSVFAQLLVTIYHQTIHRTSMEMQNWKQNLRKKIVPKRRDWNMLASIRWKNKILVYSHWEGGGNKHMIMHTCHCMRNSYTKAQAKFLPLSCNLYHAPSQNIKNKWRIYSGICCTSHGKVQLRHSPRKGFPRYFNCFLTKHDPTQNDIIWQMELQSEKNQILNA